MRSLNPSSPRPTKRVLPCLATAPTPLFAHADCEANFPKWMAQLHSGRTLDDVHARCRVWPAHPMQTIAVLPRPHANANDKAGEIDLEVLVADTRSGTSVARTFEPSAIRYDAVRFGALDVDIKPYPLAPGNPAFGVSVEHEYTPIAAPKGEVSTSLYVIDGQRLRKVLDRLQLDHAHGRYDIRGVGFYVGTQRTIEFGPAGEDGYAALKIKEKSVRTENKDLNDNADKQTTYRNYTIEYRNVTYRAPKNLTALY